MSFTPGSSPEHALGGILVGLKGQEVFVQVSGRGTHLNSQPLHAFFAEMMARGLRSFFLDLACCTYLDSTFLGVLAGACLRLRKLGEGSFSLYSVNPRNLELLQTLGIARFFQIHVLGAPPGDPPARLYPLPSCPGSEPTSALVLEAHRTLVAVDEKNAPRFKDVIDCLEQELPENRRSPEPSPTRNRGH